MVKSPLYCCFNGIYIMVFIGQLRHRSGARKPQQTALPPELDAEQNPSPLHYLPGCSLLAVCRAGEEDLAAVLPYKVGINSFHFLGSLCQALLCAYYTSHPWERDASVGVSISAMCVTLLQGIMLGLVVLRSYHVRTSGLLPTQLRQTASVEDAPPPSVAPPSNLPKAPRVGLRGSNPPRSVGKAQAGRK